MLTERWHLDFMAMVSNLLCHPDFFFSSRRRHTRLQGDWSSDVCSSDLIRTDFLDFTVDCNPYKHGRFLPGTHIPIHAPEKIRQTRPDYVLILPWNLKDEIKIGRASCRERV